MAKMKADKGNTRRSGDDRVRRIDPANEYVPLDRMPRRMGHQGPVFRVPEQENGMGYIPLAMNDWNGE